MSLTKLTTNLNNIQSLADKPSAESDALKQLFDKAGNDIKTYINEVLTAEIDSLIASQASSFNNQIAQTNATVTANANTITSAQLDKIYPVGSIYMSVNSTSPASFIGGTWERIQNRFLLASGSSYTNGSTGGSATHTHTNPNTGTYSGNTGGSSTSNTGSTVLTINQIPAHSHTIKRHKNAVAGGDAHTTINWAETSYDDTKTTSSVGGSKGHTHTMAHTHTINHSHTIGATGSSSNMPPYLAVYMWKRIS